jgi:hypothetical protein
MNAIVAERLRTPLPKDGWTTSRDLVGEDDEGSFGSCDRYDLRAAVGGLQRASRRQPEGDPRAESARRGGVLDGLVLVLAIKVPALGCHQMGSKGTRELHPALGTFESSVRSHHLRPAQG